MASSRESNMCDAIQCERAGGGYTRYQNVKLSNFSGYVSANMYER